MNATREIALSVGAGAVFGGAIVAGLDWEPQTSLFPTVIGAVGLGLAVWALAADIVKRRNGRADDLPIPDGDRARARGAFIWIGVFFAAVLAAGFEWGLSLAALAFYRWEARLGWIGAIVAGAICGAFLYVAAHFLNIPLYPGLIQEAFF